MKNIPSHFYLYADCGPNKDIQNFYSSALGITTAVSVHFTWGDRWRLWLFPRENKQWHFNSYSKAQTGIEYGERKRFMEISIVTDGFHQQNHNTCSFSFKRSQYLKSANTEAAEQANEMLRAIESSTTYMSPQMHMKAITLFVANLNIMGNPLK